jgi:hyperosmotically inducible protein
MTACTTARMNAMRAVKRLQPPMLALLLGLPAACASTRSTGQQVDDDVVTSRVARRFIADGRVSWIDIDIDTVDSVVTLRGVTDDPRERERAETIAAQTPGVEKVVNRITLGLESTDILDGNPDTWITMKVKMALAQNATVRASDIDVDTDDRKVTLSGIVATPGAKRQAVEVAESIDGVREVVDELAVKGPSPEPDR